MYKHLLVTLDGSSLSEAVLPCVQRLMAGSGGRVTLLIVGSAVPVQGATSAHEGRLIDAVGGLQETTLQERHVHRQAETPEQAAMRVTDELKSYLESHAGKLSAAGINGSCEVALGEDPAQEIIDYARSHGVDAIAMATHGRTGLSRLVSGSVASSVLERSGLPVLLVRPQREA